MDPTERAREQAIKNLRTGVSLMITTLPKSIGATRKEAKLGIAAALAQMLKELMDQIEEENTHSAQ